MISEGGTGPDHAITIARSKTLTGYYEGFKSNPILTHRHLGQKYPIVNVGHADLVETPSGEWWMVLLASRPYGGYFRNLGRETFLVPVTWENGWPVCNYGIGLVLDEERFPNLAPVPVSDPTAYDFTKVTEMPLNMMHLRNPIAEDYKFDNGLNLRLNPNKITQVDNPVSYFALRQQHMCFEATTTVELMPQNENEAAGLVIFQNHKFNYHLLITQKAGKRIVKVVKCEKEVETVLAEMECDTAVSTLKIAAKGQELSFYCCGKPVLEGADARMLSTDVAGGFVGNTIGMYATSGGVDAGDRFARFGEIAYMAVEK